MTPCHLSLIHHPVSLNQLPLSALVQCLRDRISLMKVSSILQLFSSCPADPAFATLPCFPPPKCQLSQMFFEPKMAHCLYCCATAICHSLHRWPTVCNDVCLVLFAGYNVCFSVVVGCGIHFQLGLFCMWFVGIW